MIGHKIIRGIDGCFQHARRHSVESSESGTGHEFQNYQKHQQQCVASGSNRLDPDSVSSFDIRHRVSSMSFMSIQCSTDQNYIRFLFGVNRLRSVYHVHYENHVQTMIHAVAVIIVMFGHWMDHRLRNVMMIQVLHVP